jgi:hypothetical protein
MHINDEVKLEAVRFSNDARHPLKIEVFAMPFNSRSKEMQRCEFEMFFGRGSDPEMTNRDTDTHKVFYKARIARLRFLKPNS